MSHAVNIAIDGPAGAGKSTIAKRLAAELGYIYVDTGAMYRALALYFLEHSVFLDDEAAIESVLPQISVSLGYQDGAQRVYLNEEDVSDRIRKEEIGNAASKTSAYPKVREKLLSLQRNLAEENDCIMDGRDIGSFVLPNAEVKIFLTASVEVRAKRRFDELKEKGEAAELSQIAEDIRVRDEQDMNRSVAPLVQAEDAVLLDSSGLSIDEVVAAIHRIIAERRTA
ncbi:MAG: (d)CMP kinase [Lachnospiraceae bacterium]|nr:(d)CMP kinase [Lachnospiraceae bacterium]